MIEEQALSVYERQAVASSDVWVRLPSGILVPVTVEEIETAEAKLERKAKRKRLKKRAITVKRKRPL